MGRGARVAINVQIFSLGERQRRQLCLALADVSQFVGRPNSWARVAHRLADEVVDGGRRQRREEVANEARVICAASARLRSPAHALGYCSAGLGPVCAAERRGRRTEDINFPNLLVVEAPLHREHSIGLVQRVVRHLGVLVAVVVHTLEDAASLHWIKAHEAIFRAEQAVSRDVR